MIHNIEVLKHADVRGNVLNYVKLTVGEKTELINIGEKTYDRIKKILYETTAEKETEQNTKKNKK